jgi:hypothetical protein
LQSVHREDSIQKYMELDIVQLHQSRMNEFDLKRNGIDCVNRTIIGDNPSLARVTTYLKHAAEEQGLDLKGIVYIH